MNLRNYGLPEHVEHKDPILFLMATLAKILGADFFQGDLDLERVHWLLLTAKHSAPQGLSLYVS